MTDWSESRPSPAPKKGCDAVRDALEDARDNGLIYWEPNTERGRVNKALMLARIDAALSAPTEGPASQAEGMGGDARSAIGSPEWCDEAERSEWAFMAKMLGEAIDYIRPANLSGLGVAKDVAEARAKEGWRTYAALATPTEGPTSQTEGMGGDAATVEKLRKLAEAAAKVAPGPWEADGEETEGGWGKHDEFVILDAQGRRLCGTENADHTFGSISEENDGDGGRYQWNEPARVLMHFIAACDPMAILSLLATLTPPETAEAVRAENEAYRNAARDMLNNWRFGGFYAPQQPEPLYVRKFAQLYKDGSERIAYQSIVRSRAIEDAARSFMGLFYVDAEPPMVSCQDIDPQELAACYDALYRALVAPPETVEAVPVGAGDKKVCPICKGHSRFDECPCHYAKSEPARSASSQGGE